MTFRPFKGWREALSEFGWLIPTVLVFILGAFMLSQYDRSTRTLPKSVLPGGTTVQTVAREPGVGYDVLKFCNDPATKVAPPMLPVPEDSGRLIAQRGLEQVNWPGGTIAAMHYFTDSLGANKGEPVEMTPAAVACFEKKAGIKK